MSRYPDFIIAGAQKSGTTFLTSVLSRHPSVHLMPREPLRHGYFDQELNFRRGPDWYTRMNRGVNHHKVIGQTSASCHLHEAAPFRIAREIPEARVILILRDPVTRAYSHYRHVVTHHQEIHPFDKAIELESERMRRGPVEWMRYSYVARGHYREQLLRFQAAFPADQLLVLQFEAVRRAPDDAVFRLCDFLGLDRPTDPASLYKGANTNPGKVPRFKAPQYAGYAFARAGLWKVSQFISLANREVAAQPPMDVGARVQLERLYADDVEFMVREYAFERELWTNSSR